MKQAGKVFHVTAEEAKQTLPAMLRRWIDGASWGQVRRLMETRRVTVNGNVCFDEGRRLKLDEVVKVLETPLAPLPTSEDVVIVHVDAQVVVVEKPAGLTSVRHAEEVDWSEKRKNKQPTLDELLPKLLAAGRRDDRRLDSNAARRGRRLPPAPKVRPVHRLDRETSGLMIFARTPEAEEHLIHQFRKHTVHRRYVSMVLGAVEDCTIETILGRDRGDGRRGSITDAKSGQHAVTHVALL
ncbi:MAG: pseudouridine synthase, partial [Planctomycetia bacterium]